MAGAYTQMKKNMRFNFERRFDSKIIFKMKEDNVKRIKINNS